MKREKRYQAAGPPRRWAAFLGGLLFLGGAQIQQGSTGEGPVEPCAGPRWGYLPQRARGLERAAPWGLFCFLRRAYYLAKMRSMRRNGSAAPHSNWSPTVKAER